MRTLYLFICPSKAVLFRFPLNISKNVHQSKVVPIVTDTINLFQEVYHRQILTLNLLSILIAFSRQQVAVKQN